MSLRNFPPKSSQNVPCLEEPRRDPPLHLKCLSQALRLVAEEGSECKSADQTYVVLTSKQAATQMNNYNLAKEKNASIHSHPPGYKKGAGGMELSHYEGAIKGILPELQRTLLCLE